MMVGKAMELRRKRRLAGWTAHLGSTVRKYDFLIVSTRRLDCVSEDFNGGGGRSDYVFFCTAQSGKTKRFQDATKLSFLNY